MSNKKILIVEDETDIRELINHNFKKQGFLTDTAGNGNEALSKIRLGKYGLILLDLMLPVFNGVDLCRVLKGDDKFSGIPVIILTARSDEIDKVLGLELGADDYITKPFSLRELVARVRAVLRRYSAASGNELENGLIKAGPLLIDTEKYHVSKYGIPLKISAMEFKLLIYLAQRPGKILNRDFLLDAAWGRDATVEPRTIDVHIRRLREKIEEDPSDPQFIRTKWGMGYYFTDGGELK
ncbi:MAG: response regulator transcription factor [Nitrospiraceae bacterium]|nr:response regulator transcription factor [Nitrospiraceae bacterium]